MTSSINLHLLLYLNVPAIVCFVLLSLRRMPLTCLSEVRAFQYSNGVCLFYGMRNVVRVSLQNL